MLYEWLVLVHVVMAVVWVGGGAILNLQAIRIQRGGEPERLAGFGREVEWIGTRIFMPASLLLLGSGIWAALDADWDFGAAWISIGFAGYALSFLAGITFLGPESGRIAKLAAAEGASSAAVQARLGRLLALTRIELLILLVVIWAMVTKPGL